MEQLNIKAKNFRDLLTDEPFSRQDIITLQVGSPSPGRAACPSSPALTAPPPHSLSLPLRGIGASPCIKDPSLGVTGGYQFRYHTAGAWHRG